MAGMFYSLQEAAEKLNISEDQLKEFVQEGKLREFRDGPNLLFKVEEIEALMSEAEAERLEAPAPEAGEEEAVEFDFAEPEAEEEESLELDLSEPEAEEEEPLELSLSEEEAEEEEPLELNLSEPEPLEEETADIDLAEPEEEISELEALSEEDVPSLSALEADMSELEEPEAEESEAEEIIPDMEITEEPESIKLEPSESAANSDEILLAPETGAPLMSNDLTDADTALTGLGTSVLGETDQDYAITDDTLAETAIPTGAGGTTPSVPLEEIEEDVNLDTFGSGSGLLDLSLQADDTSLGGILDEIYTAEGEGQEPAEAEADEGAVAGIEPEQMISEEEIVAPQPAAEAMALAGPVIETAPDAQSNMLGMLLFLPLLIVVYTAVVAVSGLRGVMPSILAAIQGLIWYIMGAAAVLTLLVTGAAFLLTGERSAAPPKEKKAKPPKPAKAPKLKKGKKGKEA